MAGLKWVRVDTAFPRNHKVITLIGEGHHRAALVYLCGLALAGEQGTDGWVPEPLLPHIHGRPTDAQHLVEVGLWLPRPGGWDIKDWDESQPTSQETKDRSARARAAALQRWHGPDQPTATPNGRKPA